MVKWFQVVRGYGDTIRELLGFLWKERLWWLIPMVIVLLLFGVLLALGQSSPVAPFVYTLF